MKREKNKKNNTLEEGTIKGSKTMAVRNERIMAVERRGRTDDNQIVEKENMNRKEKNEKIFLVSWKGSILTLK